MHQAANGNLKYNVTPVVPFVMCLSGFCWALQLNLSMRTAGKNNIVLQAGWQISAKQSPNTITSGHLGPVSTEPFFFGFFFLMSSSVVFLLPYRMPSSILYPFAAHVSIHSFYCPSATSHARAYALSLEFYDFINSASAYLQHCSHCFPPTVCGHLCVLKLPPFFPSVLPLLNSFTVVILTPVKTSPPPQAYLPFK